MKRLRIIAALAAVLMATGCASQAELNSLRAENAVLKQQLSFYTDSETGNATDETGNESNSGDTSPYEQYVKDHKVYLNNYDVQYDMGNNLNQKFTLVGEAELDDYYNYGYDDAENEFFCVMVVPEDGKYTNRWYIYAKRADFKDFFDDLKRGNCNVEMVAVIPASRYEQGQNCMAMLDYVAW